MKKNNQQQIRNSTADFLIFTRQNGENGIAVRIEDENVWLRAEAIAELFQKSRSTIVEHLKNIFASGELNENSVCRKFRQTAEDGKNYQVKFYSLEAIISVGYRADSQRAIEFRKWATNVLSNFARKGYVLDKNRLINDQVFSMQYFDELLAEIREIRASERKFIPMTMEDWKAKLDVFLKFNEETIGDGIGKISHEVAKAFAESEFEKYRIVQDRNYRSDFDSLLEQTQTLNLDE